MNDNKLPDIAAAASAVSASRRTVIRGAAWSLPVIAAAVATPVAAATGATTITAGPAPSATGVCTPVGNFIFTVTTGSGTPVAGEAVTVTLPTGLLWADSTTGSKTLHSDASGVVTVTGLQAVTLGELVVTAQVVSSGEVAFASVTIDGIWFGSLIAGTGGQGLTAVFNAVPANPASPGTPDDYAYCLDQAVSSVHRTIARVGGPETFVGSAGNRFPNADVQQKILWVLANGYPRLDLAAFGVAVGVPGISEIDAIKATQFAIWRYAHLTSNASWTDLEDDLANGNPNPKNAYKALLVGANASTSSPGTPAVVTVPKDLCTDYAQTHILVNGSL
ncbi:MAG: Cys-Gln thioester bond-forming surface protein [Pseudorhodoferax sp.]